MNIPVIWSDPIWVLAFEKQEGRGRAGYLAGANRWPSARWRPSEGRPCLARRLVAARKEQPRDREVNGRKDEEVKWTQTRSGSSVRVLVLVASAWLIFFSISMARWFFFFGKNCKYAISQCPLYYFRTGFYILSQSSNKSTFRLSRNYFL